MKGLCKAGEIYQLMLKLHQHNKAVLLSRAQGHHPFSKTLKDSSMSRYSKGWVGHKQDRWQRKPAFDLCDQLLLIPLANELKGVADLLINRQNKR